MDEKKSLASISWQVTEPEYRADSALSYSTLAKFNREGFLGLPHLFDKIESPSLTFGSMVDTLITGSDEEFKKQFKIVDDKIIPSDALVKITKKLFDTFKFSYNDLLFIPEDEILNAISDISWNNHWLPRTRVKKIKEDCVEYYKALFDIDGCTIIGQQDYEKALNAVNTLKSSPSTKFYFEPNNVFDDNIQRFYQLKFKATLEDIPFRIMADELIVIHDKKIVIPVDLKTSSKPEWNFYKSFIDWGYWIQAELYWRVIKDNMNKDPYFKDFTLLDYRFIVVNKETLTPLVWEFPDTTTTMDLYIGNYYLRHPFNIAKELVEYLKTEHDVPIGIYKNEPNDIRTWLEYND